MKLDVILLLIRFVSRLWGWWREVASFRWNRISLIYIMIIIDWLPFCCFFDSLKTCPNLLTSLDERKWWKDSKIFGLKLKWFQKRFAMKLHAARNSFNIYWHRALNIAVKISRSSPDTKRCAIEQRSFLESRTKHYSEQKHFSRAKTKKNTKGEGTIFHSYQRQRSFNYNSCLICFLSSLLCWLARTGKGNERNKGW